MDHRSYIHIDLRPDKDSPGKLKSVRGFGSKEGSPPILLLDKEEAGRGAAQPARKQITLSFRRTGGRIEFFCDGERVAETWALPKETVLWLWVCGKGTLNGAKVEGGR